MFFQVAKLAIVIVTLLKFGAAHADEDKNSANYWHPKCKAVVMQRSTDFYAGACLGIALMLKQMGRYYQEPLRVCVPDNATMEQIIRVISQFVDDNPSQWHEPYTVLALMAVKRAWPCNGQ